MPKQLQTGMLPHMLATARWLCRQSSRIYQHKEDITCQAQHHWIVNILTFYTLWS